MEYRHVPADSSAASGFRSSPRGNDFTRGSSTSTVISSLALLILISRDLTFGSAFSFGASVSGSNSLISLILSLFSGGDIRYCITAIEARNGGGGLFI